MQARKTNKIWALWSYISFPFLHAGTLFLTIGSKPERWCLNRGIIITTGNSELFIITPVSAKPGISQALYHSPQLCTLPIQPTKSQRKTCFTNLLVISNGGGGRNEQEEVKALCCSRQDVGMGAEHPLQDSHMRVQMWHSNTQSCCTESPGDVTKSRALVLIVGGGYRIPIFA